jgi:hypothetical protein
MDPVPDLALSVGDLQDANKKYFLHIYYAFMHLQHSSKTKRHKK